VNYILDAGSMIAFLDDEPGAEIVEDSLTEPGSTCYAHIFNLATDHAEFDPLVSLGYCPIMFIR